MSVAILKPMTAAERGDELLEVAREAVLAYAQHELKCDFQDGGHDRGSKAMDISLALKALRRPIVVERLDAERLARAKA